jgi:ABC-2 type transport system ATP-binding protein
LDHLGIRGVAIISKANNLPQEPILQVKNVKKNYGSLQALKGVSFEVFPGEIFALIGPNGAGKSTALRIIATILKPDEGDVQISGYSVLKQPEKVRELITYLPEDAGAYKYMTGKEYLFFMASLYFESKEQIKEAVALAEEIADLGNSG